MVRIRELDTGQWRVERKSWWMWKWQVLGTFPSDWHDMAIEFYLNAKYFW
jgi:hypothetical protein